MSTRVQGELSITPPLDWKQISSSRFHHPWNTREAAQNTIVLRVGEEEKETPEGTLIRKFCSQVDPILSDRYKAYGLEDNVRELIESFPEHRFSGEFDCEGDEPGDLWRVVVKNNEVHKVVAQIVWPEV